MTENWENQPPTEEEQTMERGKTLVLVRFAVAGALLLILVGVLLFIFAEPPGEIYVTSNIPGAVIVIDSYPTEFTTNDLLKEVPPGEHLITVEKSGFRIVGDFFQKVDVSSNKCDTLFFYLDQIEAPIGYPGN